VTGRWLLKVILGIALLGFVVVEVGSPVVTRLQLDGAAHDVADEATHELAQAGNAAAAETRAREVATEEHATLTGFTVDEQGFAHVIVFRRARSVLLKKWSRTRPWYEVKVAATGTKGGA
jgi:hypothetical protein